MKSIIIHLKVTKYPEEKKYGVYYEPDQVEKYKNCKIKEIAWIILNEKNGNMIKKHYMITFVKNIDRRKESHKIIPRESIQNVIKFLLDDMKNTYVIIGHSLSYIKHVLMAEMYRNGFKNLDIVKKFNEFCTMKEGLYIVCRTDIFGTYKFPTLQELCEKLDLKFDEPLMVIDNVKNIMNCYVKIKQLKRKYGSSYLIIFKTLTK